MNRSTALRGVSLAGALIAAGAAAVLAGPGVPHAGAPAAASDAEQPEYPPFDQVAKGLEKVVSTADGAKPLYDLYADKESGRLLAALPATFDQQLLMIAPTISGGDPQAGVMGSTIYAKWRKVGKNLLLVQPDLTVKTGDDESKSSVENLYTGSVVVDAPILTMSPEGGPVVDLGALMTQRYGSFYGNQFGGFGPQLPGADARLAALTAAKAFPKNLVVEYEMPRADGRLVRLKYHVGTLEGTPGFEPREADARVGYFYNWSQDFAATDFDDVMNRYITRWHVEKADPSLKLSPPKRPIVWYIEHTTPIRYRTYVREGILAWNEAFEKIGITGALEVYQQDERTGAHMDKDPEDARYNFFRWNTSNQGYAIGPSRWDPYTGEILDADVVWHQGLTRAVRTMLGNLSADLTEQAFGPETLEWLADRPHWDPRVRMAPPERRDEVARAVAAGHDRSVAETVSHQAIGDSLTSNSGVGAGACKIGNMLTMNIGLAASAFDAGLLETDSDETLDGLPIEFMGPMIRYISAHEVGHCLGLQHNFAASTIRSLEELNQPGYDGPVVGSVMEYAAPNINADDGPAQGPYTTPGVGPYDEWAIAYGYGPKDTLEGVLKRNTEPDLIWGSPVGTIGPDPRINTWELGAEPLAFCESRMRIVRDLRSRIVEDLVGEGESWQEARQRFAQLTGTQLQTLFVASRYLGGSYTSLAFKGDPDAKRPIEDLPAEKQRAALTFMIENALRDDAYGVTPELVRHMGKEYWFDPQGMQTIMQDPSYTVHDTVAGIQATALTLVMNPTTLRRLYDNEFRAAGDDAITVAEVVRTVGDEVWRECAQPRRGATASDPAISSFRRNLQREHVERLIDLALLTDSASPSIRTIASLAVAELDRVDGHAEKALAAGLDPYCEAHLTDVRRRIEKARDAAYVVTR